MKKLILVITAVVSMAAAYPLDSLASYYELSSAEQKVGAAGLALGAIAALVAVADKPFDAVGIGSLAFSTLFIAPLAGDFLDTNRHVPKKVGYDRLSMRLICALCSMGLGVLGCKIIKESRAGTFDKLLGA